MDESDDRPQYPIAPRFRRVIAVLVDFSCCIGLMHLVFGLGALVVPADSSAAAYAVMFPTLLLGFGYLLVVPMRADTLGKWLFGLRIERTVKSSTHVRPTFGAMLFRTMLLGLWPINLAMMLFSKSRQHLGDRLANTTVRFPNTNRHLAVGLVVGLVAAVLILKAGAFAVKAAGTRTQAYAAAVASLQQQELSPTGLPHGFVIGERGARFDLVANEKVWRIGVRFDEAWVAEAPEELDSPGVGSCTFAFGAATVSTSF